MSPYPVHSPITQHDWGPRPIAYPPPQVTPRCQTAELKRDHVLSVATHYLGLPYKHKHIPQEGGLDCSNFTAWVYNIGLGIQIPSHVVVQSESAGRRLEPQEALEPGDLLFFWNPERTQIGHVAFYLDPERILDETEPAAQIRAWRGWYRDRFAFARRIVPNDAAGDLPKP